MKQHDYNIHQHIIDRCLKGERSAQYELYQLYSRAMYNVCYRIVRNEGDAEDVLQDAFVSAFQHLHSYNGDAAFGAWLKRIVVNKSLNVIKRKGVNLIEADQLPDVPDEPTSWSNDDLDVRRIQAAMDLLPEGYRLVFSLYLLEGYDHGEIADILGISESTSKSQFNRSKKKIREILERQHG